jgi:undecaprenyl-diphosphatase
MTVANGLQHKPEPADTALRRLNDHLREVARLLLRPARVHPPAMIEPRQLAIGAAIVVAAILVCMLFIDRAATNAVLKLPHWVNWSFDQITDYGKSGWFLWPIGVVFLALAALPSERLTHMSQRVFASVLARTGFLFLAIALPSLFDTIIKRMIGRARPMVTGIADPFVFSPFIWRSDYASLPSGHATTAFAVVVAIGSLWPRARTVVWIYAIAIAISRIVLTAHYASDVLAGAVVGIVGAILVRRYFALRHLAFGVGPDGTVHQYPGPSLKRIKAVARELLA